MQAQSERQLSSRNKAIIRYVVANPGCTSGSVIRNTNIFDDYVQPKSQSPRLAIQRLGLKGYLNSHRFPSHPGEVDDWKIQFKPHSWYVTMKGLQAIS